MAGLLDGRVVLITGAARGQGAEEARQVIAAGGSVVVADVLDDLAGGLAADLGKRALAVHLDVTSAAGWGSAVGAAVERFGRLDGLVNNAGIYTGAPFGEMTEELFRRVLDVNLVGPFLGITAALAHLTASRGAVVNIASIAAIRAVGAGSAAYGASKFGLRGLTHHLAAELGPHGVRVNSIMPGVIRTPMIDGVLEAREESIAAGIPMGRVGEPADIAGAVVFLLSDAAAFVTGAELVVDGGSTA
jgi:3alpha(or 20beta)-hydroxysteroid dehydrogenase